MSGSGDDPGRLSVPLESFDDRKRDPRSDRMRAEIARGVTHAHADSHDALDLLRSFRAQPAVNRTPRPRNRRRVQGFDPSPYSAEVLVDGRDHHSWIW